MTGIESELTEARFDLVDRFEQVIDLQATVLVEVGERAGNVTRLVVLVLGLVLSALSVGIRQGDLQLVTLPTVIAFGLGVAGLVTALAGAILTYLSVRIKFGIHPASAATLEETPVDRDEYSRLVAGSYADVLEANSSVLDVNVRRLRYTLASLVFGLGHVGVSTLQFVTLDAVSAKWLVAGIGSLTITGVCVAVLSGRFLVLEGR